jgi:hypothetical protein
MSKEFEWPFEISGFGGDYEQACRDMTKAGVLWLREHPEELEKWRKASHEYRERTGKDYTPTHVYPPSYKEFEGAIVKACDDCTGAMFGASQGHAIAIFTHGWDEYVKHVMDKRQESEVQK